MEYLFAPMEGITGYVFRNAHHRHFHGIKEYTEADSAGIAGCASGAQ